MSAPHLIQRKIWAISWLLALTFLGCGIADLKPSLKAFKTIDESISVQAPDDWSAMDTEGIKDQLILHNPISDAIISLSSLTNAEENNLAHQLKITKFKINATVGTFEGELSGPQKITAGDLSGEMYTGDVIGLENKEELYVSIALIPAAKRTYSLILICARSDQLEMDDTFQSVVKSFRLHEAKPE